MRRYGTGTNQTTWTGCCLYNRAHFLVRKSVLTIHKSGRMCMIGSVAEYATVGGIRVENETKEIY